MKKDNKKQNMNNFNWTHYNKEDIEILHDKIIETYKNNLKSIKEILPECRTFENTALAMNRLDLDTNGLCYSDVILQIHLLSNVHHDAIIRKSAQDLEEKLSAALIDITMNRDLYTAMQEYMACTGILSGSPSLGEGAGGWDIKLGSEAKLIIQDTNLGLSRMGFSLPDNEFKKLKKKMKELATVSSKFRVNINNYEDSILVTREELDGCSQRYIDSLCMMSGSRPLGRVGEGVNCGDSVLYKVTLSYPDSIPFMNYAKDSKKRKELSDKISQKGGKENLKVLNKMLVLRNEISDILGYDNYVNYKVEDRMARNLENITELLNKVKDNIKDKVKSDVKDLKSHAKAMDIKDFKYYDQAYVMTNLEESIYNIDKESLRPYFETNRVIKYMLDLFGDLFAFKYEEINPNDIGFKLWDKDVKIYKILNDSKKYKLAHSNFSLDQQNKKAENAKEYLLGGVKENKIKEDELLSYLILDLYPREGKYGHAAAFNTVEHGDKVITLVCNFPSPKQDSALSGSSPNLGEVRVGAELNSSSNLQEVSDRAEGIASELSLLSLDEVETLYHEFGHATHFMLADTEYAEHNGFHVAWDFVETPSQMLEEWVYNEVELKKLGRHHHTGESIPDDVIQNILNSRKFMSGYSWMRQIMMSQFDIDIHLDLHKKVKKELNKKTNGIKVEKYYQKLLKKNIRLDINEKSLFPASFGHLDGYDAGYYSYLWAKVYALDFYSIFEKAVDKNLKNINEVGLRYRKEVLGVGSSRDELATAKAFLGRKLSDKAFVKSL